MLREPNGYGFRRPREHDFFFLKVETILMRQIKNTKEGLVVPCRNTLCSHPDLLECFGKTVFTFKHLRHAHCQHVSVKDSGT